jgi:hypothetical protein
VFGFIKELKLLRLFLNHGLSKIEMSSDKDRIHPCVKLYLLQEPYGKKTKFMCSVCLKAIEFVKSAHCRKHQFDICELCLPKYRKQFDIISNRTTLEICDICHNTFVLIEEEEKGLCPLCSSSPGVFNPFLSALFKRKNCNHGIQVRKYQNAEICRICDDHLFIFATCPICKFQICLKCSELIKCLACKKLFFNVDSNNLCFNCGGSLFRKFALDLRKAKFIGDCTVSKGEICPKVGQL